MPDSRIAFCDTGFVIRLMDKTDELHENAKGYFRYLIEHGYTFKMSTIAVAEYCVRGCIEEIPLRQILLSPFNAVHASEAGKCANILFEARSKGMLSVNSRFLIQNDTKMLVQAQCENAEIYLTADTESKKMYDVLKGFGKLTFVFVDIHHTHKEQFGILDL